ncbi:putative ATP citrate synthase [Rosa chinensis]|uniref:Putative ATP citrate synthase n=1 Tax=Rosa chinensis TaxID=74649 RepID=A0A2P6RRG9_ROSCH|nr:putative ATP citrate synthase [Rosa chinensis]
MLTAMLLLPWPCLNSLRAKLRSLSSLYLLYFKRATSDPDDRKRALVIGGGIANFTDVAATFNGIIRALKEKETKLKVDRMHLYVRGGGPNYQRGLAKMRALVEEIGLPIKVYGPEATMTGICKQAIQCITAAAWQCYMKMVAFFLSISPFPLWRVSISPYLVPISIVKLFVPISFYQKPQQS